MASDSSANCSLMKVWFVIVVLKRRHVGHFQNHSGNHVSLMVGQYFIFLLYTVHLAGIKKGGEKLTNERYVDYYIFFQTLLYLSFPKKNLKYYKGVYIVWEIYLIRVPWAEKGTKGLRWVLCYNVWTLVGEQPGPGLVIRDGCLSTSKVHAYGWGFHGPSWA